MPKQHRFRPTRRSLIVQGLESAEVVGPFRCSSGRWGRCRSSALKPQGPDCRDLALAKALLGAIVACQPMKGDNRCRRAA
eukprot:1521673-Alexandrium_andersonii.AAC.1